MRVTRFAPSPTGDLHLGGALVALASYWLARTSQGRFVLRVEDLDTPRVVSGSRERILDDLTWLGFDWDQSLDQSSRTPRHERALQQLASEIYPCDCSRAEIQRIASAPHAGEELVYPGTCRNLSPARQMKRDPAIRIRVPQGARIFRDELAGEVTQDLARDVGDFVLRRGDGVFAYQLAVVVDDGDAGVTDIVRGDDLLSSTPRQIYLYERLGLAVPRFWHVPLVLDAEGNRLQKRTPGAHVRALRDRGITREEIVGVLAGALGLTDGAPCSIADLLTHAAAPLAPRALRVPARWT